MSGNSDSRMFMSPAAKTLNSSFNKNIAADFSNTKTVASGTSNRNSYGMMNGPSKQVVKIRQNININGVKQETMLKLM